MNSSPRAVAAVIVSFNRRALLEEALVAVEGQTIPPRSIIVVDNGSTDGSVEYLRSRAGIRLIEPVENLGGAGGFALGMAQAVLDGVDWIWVMDDDTIPMADALERLLEVADHAPRRTVVLGSTVLWTDGRRSPMNSARPHPLAGRSSRARASRLGAIPVRSTSFVSMLVSTSRVREVGLPVIDYFIWNDDFEFSARALRGRVGLVVGRSRVVHKTAAFDGWRQDPGERFYFEVRNKLWVFLHSNALTRLERALYAGSTFRRWAMIFARSKDRGMLTRSFMRGVRHGISRRPRPNELAVSADPAASLLLARFDQECHG